MIEDLLTRTTPNEAALLFFALLHYFQAPVIIALIFPKLLDEIGGRYHLGWFLDVDLP